MDPLLRNNVQVGGRGDVPILFAHGFGCDQNMWRFVAPAFEADHRTVLFDHVGYGGSDVRAWDKSRYNSLTGYAQDVVELSRALGVKGGVFVGHSVSAMIGVIAARMDPSLFDHLVLVGPSPRYLNDEASGYVGGFSRGDIDGLLDALDSNYLGWSRSMAPVIMGNPDRPHLGEELTNSFCRTDPEIARHFARVTFLSDNRDDLAQVQARALVLQCSQDVIAPEQVGRYVHARMKESELVILNATGHCPNLSAPDEVIEAMRRFLVR